ncbi:DNA polymerase III subunit delta [Acinetobacter populi]|uniref:DNA polymerase III subunit delta n=1 Tax=Acinetobacter populi TaxID=1582270 RepID=A0A1Z9Z1Z6_9GAMM|nr:DNA polymerase III subunit delta [Acinetobacter populi]OUY08491.1 DNA polymerase III subunit delta [Acinetobacter populi]
MKLDYTQALNRITQVQGVWLMHGNEPLLEQNLISALRKHWQQQNIERQRFDLQNVNDWKQIFSALNSLSLFSTQLAIEVHGNIKPDAQGLKQLKAFLQNPQDNVLVIIFPKQESQSLKSAFFQTIEANGTLIGLTAYSRQDQQRILQIEAEKMGIQLTSQAWQWLLYHHENNLLSARNSLINVADSFSELEQIDIEQLQQSLQDQSRYSTFDLGDACLKGDLAQAIKILNFLLESGEAHALIFWVLQKEMRLLLQLFEQPQNALQLGIWKNKIALYQQALRRCNPSQLITWSSLLLRTDNAIKGIGHENSQDLLLQLVCALSGKPVLTL